MRRTNVDQQPESEFQRRAKDLLRRRLAATTHGDRAALEAELAALLAMTRGRRAWDAMRDAEAVSVPRDTRRDGSCHESADRKQLAAGDVDR